GTGAAFSPSTATGSQQPLLSTYFPTGTVLMGTGGVKSGTGFFTPQLYVTGRVPTQKIGSVASGLSGPRVVAVQGRYAYVTSYSNISPAIFDVSNPAPPAKIGSTTTGLSSPYAVTVQGRYAYVTSQGNNSLVIFDVSNPAAPAKIGSTTTG